MAVMSSNMHKLLIVGCGLTGALTANLINREAKKSVQIHIWEKDVEAGHGGRMCTCASPSSSECTADLGAQYVTASLSYVRSHAQFYEVLLEANVLKPLNGTIDGLRKPKSGTLNFVAPSGTSSIVKHFAHQKNLIYSFGEQVTRLDFDATSKAWLVTSKSGKTDTFNSVVLTTPVPQILELNGEIQGILDSSPGIKENLEKVTYSSRYALVLFYDTPCEDYFQQIPWVAKYFSDEEIIRFVSIDNKKRGNEVSLPALVVHSSVEFGAAHLETDIEQVQKLMVNELERLLPAIPEAAHTKCHLWRYSQVSKAYPDNPGCLILNESPFLIAGGDGFSHSSFDGCIESAVKIVEETLKHLS